MGRERPDMFDVASGDCELVDFLLTRFNSVDLKVRIRVDPLAHIDEPAPPPPEDGAEPGAIPPTPIPVPSASPPAPVSEPRAAALETPPQPPAEPEPEPEPVLEPEPEAAPSPVDLLSLIQGFHDAAQRYNNETAWEPPAPDEPQ